MNLVIVAIIAVIIGLFSVMAGLGGGVLMVPVLALMNDYPFPVIVGSVLISLTVPTLVGSVGAIRRDEVDFRLAFLFEVPTAIGVVIGANLAVSLNEGILKLIFAIVAFILSIELMKKLASRRQLLPRKSVFWKKVGEIPPFLTLEKKGASYRISLTSLMGGGMIIGLLSGMLGVGGGWIKTPLLVLAFGVPPSIATGTAIFMILITSAIGGTTHLLAGNFNLDLILTLMSAFGIGAFIGDRLKSKMDAEELTKIIIIVLFLVSAAMFVDGMRTSA